MIRQEFARGWLALILSLGNGASKIGRKESKEEESEREERKKEMEVSTKAIESTTAIGSIFVKRDRR